MTAFSLLLIIILLIVFFKKPKTIILRVVSVALVIVLNIILREPCSYYAFLAFMLLNISIIALLKSFLAFAIRSLLFN